MALISIRRALVPTVCLTVPLAALTLAAARPAGPVRGPAAPAPIQEARRPEDPAGSAATGSPAALAPAQPQPQAQEEPRATFAEAFAFASDRARAIELGLVPGSPEAYSYRALLAQQRGQLAEADGLLAEWAARHPGAASDPRHRELTARQALLVFDTDPARTLAHLTEALGVDLDAAPEPDTAALPSALDPTSVSDGAFLARALADPSRVVDAVTPRGLPRLAALDLDVTARVALLAQLGHPDVPGLATLVVRDLAERDGAHFGEHTIHARLLREQLDDCAAARPLLLQDERFVRVYLQRLARGADERRDSIDVRRAHLARLAEFVQRLGADFDGLRANVLYHTLVLDLESGALDRERVLAYLRLPRPARYAEPEHLRGVRTLALDEVWVPGLAAIGDDEPLVREVLLTLLAKEAGIEPFVGPVRRDVLLRLFAEAKLLAGVPDERGGLERWTALLTAEDVRALEDRVELRFPRSTDQRFDVAEPVVLSLDVKNVPELLVRLYEVDTVSHLTAHKQDVDATIDLDGLVPHAEWTYTYDTPPLQRVRREFTFAALDRRGVFVLDFVGNGLASRAIVRKGELTALVRTGAAGHVLRVLDEEGRLAMDAAVHVDGRELRADADGEVTVPFTTAPGTRTAVLRQGDFASLATFEHVAEECSLDARIHVERETLLAGHEARLIVRPRLSVAGARASVALLRDVVLHVEATDVAGVRTTSTVPGFALSDERDGVHELRLPARTVSLAAHLTAKVDVVSTGAELALATTPVTLPINGIDTTDQVASVLLTETQRGFALDVLGRNGEPIAGQVLTVVCHHRDFRGPISARLATSAAGRVVLGALPGIEALEVAGVGVGTDQFVLAAPADRGRSREVHAVAGAPIRVPFNPVDVVDGVVRHSWIELRGGVFATRHTPPTKVVDGCLEVAGLAPGDYTLTFPESAVTYDVRVTRGPAIGGHAPAAIGESARRLALTPRAPLTIVDVTLGAEALSVKLAGVTRETRVHVFATRYTPGFDVADDERGLAYEPQRSFGVEGLQLTPSSYASERVLGDELRYILERRRAARYPGNMLARAGLLLNPWVLEDRLFTSLGTGGGAGGAFGGRLGGKRNITANGRSSGSPSQRPELRSRTFANLDFLARPGVQLENLVPDAAGVVRVPIAALGDRHLVQVVALDSDVTVTRRVTRGEAPLARRDLRLADGLDPARHVTVRRELRYVAPGTQVALAADTEAKTFDSLRAVFQLFRTLGNDSELERFRFLTEWPTLSADERRARYSEFACHEVDLFLSRKDPAFFAEVVRPYLANKREKLFLDDYLLGADLTRYREPWAFRELNVVERILLLRGTPGAAERHVRDLVELLPPESFGTAMYFGAVLADGGLEATTRFLRLGGEAQTAGGVPPVVTGAPAWDGPVGNTEGDPGFIEPEVEILEEEMTDEPITLGYDAQDQYDTEVNEELLGTEPDVELRKDLKTRGLVRSFYRAVADTRELAERHYWRVPRAATIGTLVTPTPFWLDLAATPEGQPFVSTRFPAAARSLTEMLLALALLDLPFTAEAAAVDVGVDRVTLTAKSGLVVATEELVAVEAAAGAARALVGQDLYRLDEPTVVVAGRLREKLVTGELLRGVAYGCRVVVTNPSAAPLPVDLLVEVPEGAIPVRGSQRRTSRALTLGAYQSHSEVVCFYFPAAGSFSQFPLHVSSEGVLVAHAAPVTHTVVDAPSAADPTSFVALARSADLETLLGYLRDSNLERLDLARLAWRMRDRAAFDRVTALLASRRRFEPTLWAYALLHRDVPRLRELLGMREDYLTRLGGRLDCTLVSLDPTARRWYEHLEYDPLVNGRAHGFRGKREIHNASFAAQYERFLGLLAYEPTLRPEQRLAAAYYLFLQDRVGEALAMFDQVDASALAERLQYDTMQVYAAFYRSDVARARAVAAGYVDHPVTRWREWFRTALAQLDEAEGRGAAVEAGDPARTNDALAASEPAAELAVEAGRVTLTTAHATECTLSYRLLDLELLFSTNPFLAVGGGALGSVKAARTDRVTLDPSGVTPVALPAEFVGRDVLVEARVGGLVRHAVHNSSTLAVRTLEAYGQVEVRDAAARAPLPRTYVKVYVQLEDGTVRFHKDGYTDLRGRFDYATVSGPEGTPARRFALFLQHDSHGAELRQVAPPAR